MRLHIVTLVLNGMPWLPSVWAAINRVQGIDWVWHISHGVANNVNCTSWCRRIRAGLSKDGTTEFLETLRGGNVEVVSKSLWEGGKVEMVNCGLDSVEKGDIVFQCDSDELWTARQIELASMLLDEAGWNEMRFRCRYFVGPRIITQGFNNYGNHAAYEWVRMWKAENLGFKFLKHEPPTVNQQSSICHQDTAEMYGLVFDHYAYATQAQVEFKEKYYGYEGAVDQWLALQASKEPSVKLGNFLKWVKDDTMTQRI